MSSSTIWKMKTLLIDIETAPNLAYVWGLYKQNVAINQIQDTGYVLCWAAKWLGEDDVMFDSIHQSKPKEMLKGAHKLLEEADAVIHYNGTKFDIPTLNKEFLLHKLNPPSSYKQIDLLRTARDRFRFASNKLDFVAKALGVGQKFKHAGFELWVRCMAGDKAAWGEMEEYNKHDVRLLEEVYKRFLPWIRNHPNVALYADRGDVVCPACGGAHFQRRGTAFTAVGKYQRYQCNDCGHWFRDRKAQKSLVEVVSDKT
jgi:DNA polymerase elongation subunit (family B)